MRDEQFPRPLLRRTTWESLDGSWDFAVDPDAEWEHPSEVEFDAAILVPFCPETALQRRAVHGRPQPVLVPPDVAAAG